MVPKAKLCWIMIVKYYFSAATVTFSFILQPNNISRRYYAQKCNTFEYGHCHIY